VTKVKEVERRFKKDEYYGWRCAENMVDGYLAGCMAAYSYDSVFNNFKAQGSYGYILEHVPQDLGLAYLKNVQENNVKFIHKIKKFLVNDLYGNPSRSLKIPEFGIDMSPTTARYIKVLSDLTTLFGSLEGMNIVEIGAGYGGLSLVISREFKFANYYDVDLHEPGKLASRYCNKAHKMSNFQVVTPEQLDKLDNIEIDLVISNYAFSECNYETQDVYIEKILSKAKRGYITHNNSEERRNRTKSIIENYSNFKVFDYDLCKKKHPIFTWGSIE
tara:strand:- start:492 stop:1313 length:822 start_codon:yes stop_codon:yes gene_type:complete